MPVLVMLVVSSGSLSWMRRTEPEETTRQPPAPVICIDPGHPTTYNSGRRVINGLRELDINWEVGLKLEAILRDEHGLHVVRTRDDKDTLIENAERALFANAAKASLFLRLHCDAGPNRGFTLYYPNRQGVHGDIAGPSPEVMEASRRAAVAIHGGMARVLTGSLKDRGVKDEDSTKVGSKLGALTGSILSEVPVVTVEMIFLTSKHDVRFISTEEGKDMMARALAEGVIDYLATLPPEGFIPTAERPTE